MKNILRFKIAAAGMFVLCSFLFLFSQDSFAQKVYWIENTYSSPKLHRIHPDGSNHREKALTANTLPQGLAYNFSNNNLIWDEVSYTNAKINGTSYELQTGSISSISSGLSACRGIAVDRIHGKIYWTTSKINENRIYCANMDGSGQTVVKDFGSGNFNLRGIAIDIKANIADQQLYVADYGIGKIYKVAASDGLTTDFITGLPAGSNGVLGIAIDSARGKVYWTEVNSNVIRRANISNGVIDAAMISGLDRPHYITIDKDHSKIFWTEAGHSGHRLKSADIDGSGNIINTRTITNSSVSFSNPFGVVTGPNAVPIAAAINKTGAEDGTVTIDSNPYSSFTSAFSDADGDVLQSIKIISLPSNGTLRLNGSAVTVNQVISVTSNQGSLIFTPSANYHGSVSFQYRAFDGSDESADAQVNITVTPVADDPGVTNITTNEDIQSGSIVLTRNAVDGAEVSYFKITAISNGTLFQNDGVTPIELNSFITYAQGSAGLKFTPSGNFRGSASFSLRASTSAADAGLGGNTAASTITVNPVADNPAVASITTNEDTQTGSISVNRNAADGSEVTHLKITGITNGRLFQNDGSTEIANGSFITVEQGSAGLKFTPSANVFGTGNFSAQASLSAGDAGLGGSPAASTITINPVADTPSITDAETNEDTQTGSGLVISRNANDGTEVTHFKITAITGGTLYLNDGATQVTNGSYITFEQGNAGLKFTPAANYYGSASFVIQASISNSDEGLGGGTVTGTINIISDNDLPTLDAIADHDILYENPSAQTIDLSGISAGGGETQTLTITALSGNTSLVPNPTVTYTSPAAAGSLTFEHVAGQVGNAVITIRVTDDGAPARFIEKTFTVTVKKVPGNALSFDGTNDYVEVPYNESFNSNSFTVEFWAKVDGSPGTHRAPVTSRSNFKGYGFYADNMDKWQFYAGDGSNWYSVIEGNVEIGIWTHIAGTYDGSLIKLYINGELKGTQSTSFLPNTANVLKIGASDSEGSNAFFFNGAVDEVRIWNTAKSQAEIQNNMFDIVDPSAAGLSAYFRFERPDGTILKDFTSGGNNGTLKNMEPESDWIDSYAMVRPVSGTAEIFDATTMTISWNPPAKGLTPDKYYLDIDDNSDFSSPVTGYNSLDVGNVTTYNATGLTTGIEYYTRISAYYNPLTGKSIHSSTMNLGGPLPVELTSFEARLVRNKVELRWTTATEVSNYGFEIERQINNPQSEIQNPKWDKIGFVEGSGNSNSPKHYVFVDKNLKPGNYNYRLKQLDTDGKSAFYSGVEAAVMEIPKEFSLNQNYPNPFNPITKISYTIPEDSKVSLSIYNILGERIYEFVDRELKAGYYEVDFNGAHLASGTYICRFSTDKFTKNIKMILAK